MREETERSGRRRLEPLRSAVKRANEQGCEWIGKEAWVLWFREGLAKNFMATD
ncbi:hypothetical protein OCK74_08900 [Chitinophagaceae bacterium LB-8]|uniref:Uncharacterized protein n=1 Tax=Paraflavisolibacter caeni TaxID=2982496 RepID=A0A9X3BHA3_9BACT|nr:hypothetical protein [Paraflavisolibacter caeni]MCU7549232.1 hypothetical protein [Paraflavisolibacter caeni]